MSRINEEQEMPQKYMAEIHRFVQKLKDGGMAVDSTIETITTLVDDTVKYTDKLTITGNFEEVHFDKRTPEEVKTEAEAIKAKIQEEADIRVAEVDKIVTAVQPAISKQK